MNCVKYSPDGEHFASGGADGQVKNIFCHFLLSILKQSLKKPSLALNDINVNVYNASILLTIIRPSLAGSLSNISLFIFCLGTS